MIRIAVIGAGQWGPNLIRNFHSRDASEVVWVVDQSPARLEQARARFPDLRVAEDVAPVLADAGVDAVVVATPTSTHYALVRAALEHDKHVLVEKPITDDVVQAEELCALAAARGRVLMVGHVFLYNPAVTWVKHLIEAGDLGRIYYVSMVRTNLGPIRLDVDAGWDLASHDISIVNHWLAAAPERASATGGSWINPGVNDAVFATLRYPGGVLVHLQVSWLNPRKVRQITIVGERRMLTFDDMSLDEPLRLYDKQVTDERTLAPWTDTFASFRASVREGDITIPRVAMGEPLKIECGHFLDCIRGGQVPLSGGAEGLAVVRTLAAIQRSIVNAAREEAV